MINTKHTNQGYNQYTSKMSGICKPALIDKVLAMVERMIEYTEFDRYFPTDTANELLEIAFKEGYHPSEAAEFWLNEMRLPEKQILIDKAYRELYYEK